MARFPHLQLADPMTLVPAHGASKEAAVIGMSLTRGKLLLPFSLQFDARDRRVEALSLGSMQALRYDRLGPKPKTEPWTVIVSPTSVGVATIACRPGPSRASRRTCEKLAGSLKLLDGIGYPVGPSPRFAALLRRQLGGFERQMRRLNRRLMEAGGSDAQGAVSAEMADVARRCARTLAAVSVSPRDADRLAGLVNALRFVRDAYKSLAAAFRAESLSAYSTAISEIGLAESILYNRIHYLTGLGYRVAENYP